MIGVVPLTSLNDVTGVTPRNAAGLRGLYLITDVPCVVLRRTVPEPAL